MHNNINLNIEFVRNEQLEYIEDLLDSKLQIIREKSDTIDVDNSLDT